jgi:hypothetical protein
MLIKSITAFLLILFSSILIYGQITFKNQLEFTHWKEYNRDILENWSELYYQRDFLQVGFRYEINHPPDPFLFPQDTLLNEFELTYRFAEFYYKNITMRLGNFYTMFGHGLVLRTYEDRNLRVDNNIDGIMINLSKSFCKIQTIAGKMRDKYNRRKYAIYGIDGKILPRKKIHLGASYLYQDDPEGEMSEIWASSCRFTTDWGDLYCEIAKAGWYDKYSYYLSFSTTYSQFALVMEYKDYNQLSFKNTYNSEYNAAPSLTREHSFTLLNRHPHALNMDDEKGYQLELVYSPTDTWELLLNHSNTLSHEGKGIFEEYYAEVHHYFIDVVETRFAGAWNFDLTSNTNNMTTIVDALYDISRRDQLHFSYQHQHTTNKFDKSEYDTELLLFEYSRSPYFTLALVGEYTNQNQLINIQMDRNLWLYGQLTLNFYNNQQLSILYGSRQAGFVCVGGICRYEPEFEGLELKMVSRF